MSNFHKVASQSQLPVIDGVQASVGDTGYTLDDGGYWNAAQPSAPPGANAVWSFIDVLRGPPGPQGAEGVGLPGPQGQIGPPGLMGGRGPQGPPGRNAFSRLTQQMRVPAITDPPLTIFVDDTSWMVSGGMIYISGAGTFMLLSPPSGSTVPIANSGDPTNAAVGTVISVGRMVSPANQRGPMGPQGAQGPSGPPGPQGVSGASAYSTLKLDFTVPSTSGVAFVVTADSFAVGQIVYCGTGNYFSVSAVDPIADSLTLVNQHYPGGQTVGALIPVGSTVSGTGPQGPQGATGPQGPQGAQGIQGMIGVAPTGSLVMWTTGTPPGGWLLCNGQSVTIAAFPALYAVIGTSYGPGASPGSTFNVPDMRDRFPIGSSSTKPLTGVGAVGGNATHTLAIAELAAHSHSASQPDHYHSIPASGAHSHSATMPDHQHALQPFSHTHTDSGHTHSVGQISGAGGIGSAAGFNYVGSNTGTGYANLSTYTSPTLPTYMSSQWGGQPAFNTNAVGNIGPANTYSETQTMGVVGAISVGNTGSATPFSLLPPYQTINFIIKT